MQQVPRTRERPSLDGVVIIIFALAIIAVVGFVGFVGIVAPIAKATLLLVPAVFAISLVIGFASQRQNWFR